jgi:hypothetical protein
VRFRHAPRPSAWRIGMAAPAYRSPPAAGAVSFLKRKPGFGLGPPSVCLGQSGSKASTCNSGTSGNIPELYRRLEDTGHVLKRPLRTFPRGAGGRSLSGKRGTGPKPRGDSRKAAGESGRNSCLSADPIGASAWATVARSRFGADEGESGSEGSRDGGADSKDSIQG